MLSRNIIRLDIRPVRRWQGSPNSSHSAFRASFSTWGHLSIRLLSLITYQDVESYTRLVTRYPSRLILQANPPHRCAQGFVPPTKDTDDLLGQENPYGHLDKLDELNRMHCHELAGQRFQLTHLFGHGDRSGTYGSGKTSSLTSENGERRSMDGTASRSGTHPSLNSAKSSAASTGSHLWRAGSDSHCAVSLSETWRRRTSLLVRKGATPLSKDSGATRVGRSRRSKSRESVTVVMR